MLQASGRVALTGLWLFAAISCSSDGGSAASAPADVAAASGGSGKSAAPAPATASAVTTAGTGAAAHVNGSAGSSTPAVAQTPAASGGSAAPTGSVAPGSGSTPTAGSAATAGAPAANGGGAGATVKPASGTSTLFYLDNGGGRVLRSDADASKHAVIVASAGSGPDGVAVDVAGGHVFWTNMGVASADDGTVMRADLDGKNVTTIVKSGTFTPKQLKLEPKSGKLYWSDREGMRVLRANLDGSQLETLVTTGTSDSDRNDASRWCVGIALDVAAGKLYWTQKGGDNGGVGSIRRANLELPAGMDPAKRSDIEVLFDKLPEPIDLDLDLEHHFLYWTDRGDNTVSRAPLDPPAGANPAARTDREILVKGLGEAIGISLDLARGRLYYTTLAGVVAAAALDGSGAKDLLTDQGLCTGIIQVDL